MKKLIFVILLTHGVFSGISQCDADRYANDCVSGLAEGFNFLKSYHINGEPDLEKVEYSYVFTKGTQYALKVCDSNSKVGLVATIFDGKRNKIASNKIKDQVVGAIAFPCNATGIYYIQFTFDTLAARCGGSALSFKR